MKTLILTAATALIVAGPLAAQTPAEIAKAQFAKSHETGDGPRFDPTFSSSATGSTLDQALIHFASDEDEGDRRILSNVDSGMVVSTSNASSDAAAFAKAHFAKSEARGQERN